MIIGITGTLGAGKGTIVEYLRESLNFKHYSVRGFITEVIVSRGLPVNRDSMTEVGNDLRAKYGSEYIVCSLLKKALDEGCHAIIESIRTVGEARFLIERGGFLLGVDADIKARYARITKRASETDKVSFEKFVMDEQREFSNTDPSKQNLSAVMEMADVILYNNGTQKELHQQVEEIIPCK